MVLVGLSLAAACDVQQLSTDAVRTIFWLSAIDQNSTETFVVFDQIAGQYNGCPNRDFCLDFKEEDRREIREAHNYCLACDENGKPYSLQTQPVGCNQDLRIEGDNNRLVYDVTNRTTNITFDLRIFSDGVEQPEFIPDVTILVSKVCKSELAVDPQRQKQYYVPEYSPQVITVWPEDNEEIWLDNPSAFFNEQATLNGCERAFEMSPTYSDLEMDPSTGQITLTNRPQKASYQFDVLVKHQNGFGGSNLQYLAYGQPNDTPEYNPTLTIEGFEITTVCGPDSTTVGTPNDVDECQLHASEDGQWSMEWSFSSSNPACPIIEIELIEAETHQGFSLAHTSGQSNYIISLDNPSSTTMGIYQYTPEATAEGGAYNMILQKVQVTKTCFSTEKPNIRKLYTYDIPDVTEVLDDSESCKYLNQAITDYIEFPLPGCSQEYEISQQYGDIEIDSAGILTFMIRPEKVSYSFDLIVRNFGGTTTLCNGADVTQQYNPTLTVINFVVNTVCGLQSTTVTSKILPTTIFDVPPTIYDDSDGNIPSIALDLLYFDNSNSECPIQTVVPTDRGSSICRVIQSNGEFTFTLDQWPGSGAYECFALATAEGGASGIISKHYFIPFQSAYFYCVPPQSNPEDGYDYEYLPANIDSPRIRTPFDFVMADGQIRPEELVYKTDSNQIRLTKFAWEQQEYDIQITVQSSSDLMAMPETVQEIRLTTLCCPSSTILTPPVIPNQFRIPNCESYSLPAQSAFQSLNPTCPVISHSLLSGADEFDLSDQESTFRVTRKDELDYELDADYTVQATALGGATAQAFGTYNMQSICRGELQSNFQTYYTISVPKSGIVYESFPASSTEYVSQPPTNSEYLPAGHSCSQTFSYRMRGGASNPQELSIDSATGIFTLENDASMKRVYNVDIIINTSDSCSNEIEQTVSITIATVCGPDSTVLTPPDMSPICRASPPVNQLDQLSQDGTFVSENPNCPVESYMLLTGWNNVISNNFVLSERSSSFNIQMTAQAAQVDTHTTYYYVVEGTAEGGAKAEAIGQMDLHQSCNPQENLDFDKMINLFIPETGSMIESFPADSSDYISPPTGNCQREYSYRMKGAPDDSWNSPDLTIDANTGQFSLRKHFNQCRYYQVEIIVRSVDACGNVNDYIVSDISIHTVCGPDSTTVIVPNLLEMNQECQDSTELAHVDQFESSNPFCPIESYELMDQSAAEQPSLTQLFTLDYANTLPNFEVKLRPSVQSTEDVYSFSLRAQAKGGASAVLESQMRIYCDYCSLQYVLNQDFYKNIDLCLPQISSNEDFVIPVTEYLKQVVSDCPYEFAIRMTSQQSIPDELGIDQETGEIRLAMSYDRMRDYHFDILIRPLDGNNEDQTLVSDVQISIACCSDSTILTASEPDEQISQAYNLDPHQLVTTGTFSSSNTLCPIWFVKLDEPSNQYFELNITGICEYRIKLRPEYAFMQGTYDYTIMYEADGGAQLTTDGNMIVGPSSFDCDDAIAEIVPSLVEYDIPQSDEVLSQTIVDFGPYSDCFSNIQVEMQNGLQSPSYYQVDQQAGVVQFTNRGDQTVNDQIVLRLTPRQRRSLLGRSLQVQTEVTNPINVVTQCGPESTQIDSPELYKLMVPNEVTMTGVFTSSNSLCPIESYALDANGGDEVTQTSASEYFDFTFTSSYSEAHEFSVTLKEDYTQRVNDYFYYITATARGGATDTAAGYMKVLATDQVQEEMALLVIEVETETETESEEDQIQPVEETESVTQTEVENIQSVEDVFLRITQDEEKDNKAVIIVVLLVLLALLTIACCLYHTNCSQRSQTEKTDDVSFSDIQANSGSDSRFEAAKQPTQQSEEPQVAESFEIAPPVVEVQEEVPLPKETERAETVPSVQDERFNSRSMILEEPQVPTINQDAISPSKVQLIDEEQNLEIPHATSVDNVLDDSVLESPLRPPLSSRQPIWSQDKRQYAERASK